MHEDRGIVISQDSALDFKFANKQGHSGWSEPSKSLYCTSSNQCTGNTSILAPNFLFFAEAGVMIGIKTSQLGMGEGLRNSILCSL